MGREYGIEAEILERLENFGRLDPATIAQLNGRDWSRVPLGLVR
jgi:hypothetical protein